VVRTEDERETLIPTPDILRGIIFCFSDFGGLDAFVLDMFRDGMADRPASWHMPTRMDRRATAVRKNVPPTRTWSELRDAARYREANLDDSASDGGRPARRSPSSRCFAWSIGYGGDLVPIRRVH
jgi:hypothetical protein